jgi:UDP-glucose 4-epimerase
LEGVALRFFNVYGPRQRSDSPYSGVISLFVRQLLRGEPVTVFGDGEQTRDFVFVGDVVRVLVELTLRPTPPTAPVLNVGRGETVDVLRLLDAVETAFGVRVERRFAPARAGDVRHSSASVARLQENLGWVPTTTLEIGLSRLMEEAGYGAQRAAPCTDAP